MSSRRGFLLDSILGLLALAVSTLAQNMENYVAPNSTFYVYLNSLTSKTPEMFHLPFDTLTLDDNSCVVKTTAEGSGRYKLVPFEDPTATQNQFVPLISFNKTSTTTANNHIRVYADDSQTYKLLDYSIMKIDALCAIEQSIHAYYPAGTALSSNYRPSVITRRKVCFNPINLGDAVASTIYGPGITLQYYQPPDDSAFYELIYVDVLNNPFLQVAFRVGELTFNQAKQQLEPNLISSRIRNLNLEDIPYPGKAASNNPNYPKLLLNSNVTDFTMLPLASVGQQNRQFLVYQKKSKLIYLITNFNGGVNPNSNISSVKFYTSFQIKSIKYVNSEFLLFEEAITLKDINGASVQTNMNYYIPLPLGQRLTLDKLKGIKKFTRGSFLLSYSNLDRSLLLVDFAMPDLDGVINETPISTFYLSRSDYNFYPFAEEWSAHKQSSGYVPGSYRLFVSESYNIELYQYASSPTITRLLVTNRITGRDMGETIIESSMNVYTARYFSSENVVFIKFIDAADNSTITRYNTLVFSLNNPFLYYQAKQTLPTTRLLQMAVENGPDNFTTTLAVSCMNSSNPSQPLTERIRFNFKMVSSSNEYYEVIRNSLPITADSRNAFFNGNSDLSFTPVFPSGLDINLANNILLKGSFVEVSLEGDDFSKFQTNYNLRKESYALKLPSPKLSKTVMFETKSGSLTKRLLVVDSETNTGYYKYKNKKFEWLRNVVDNRAVSSVDMIDRNDAVFNISKNVFSVNVQTLEEKPITGIGSFCKSVTFVKIYHIPEMMICLTDQSIQAHYLQERFSIEQTPIEFVQKQMEEYLTKNTAISLLYSKYFPGHLMVLSMALVGADVKYSIDTFEIYSNIDLILSKADSVVLNELSDELKKSATNRISFVKVFEDHIVLLTNTNVIFVYGLQKQYSNNKKLLLKYLRTVRITDHINDFDLISDSQNSKNVITRTVNVVRAEDVRLEIQPTGNSSFQMEKSYALRLVLLIEITSSLNYKEPYSTVVMFDHTKSSYEAFRPIIRGDACKKLYMGPAFIIEGDRQIKSLNFICQEKTAGDWTASDSEPEVRVYVLESGLSQTFLNVNSRLEDFLANETDRKANINSKVFNLNITKTYYIPEFKSTSSNPQFTSAHKDNAVLKRKVLANFTETYAPFKLKKIQGTSLETEKVIEHSITFSDIYTKSEHTRISRPLASYFEGHIFNNYAQCESPMECRDAIVNATFQVVYNGELASYPEYSTVDTFRISNILLTKSYTDNYEMSYYLTQNNLTYNHLGLKETIEFPGLGANCTEFSNYENYLIGMCISSSNINTFRIFDLNDEMVFFDVLFTLPNGRVLQPYEVIVQAREKYLVLYTYSYFFKRYLTMFAFKIVNINDDIGTINNPIFNNTLKPQLGFLYLFDMPMNDNFVDFRNYPNKQNANQDKLYIFGLKKMKQDTIELLAEGFSINKAVSSPSNKMAYTVTKICDYKTLPLVFKVEAELGASYLLFQPKIIAVDSEDSAFLDTILYLPFAQDYLIRFKTSSLENTSIKTLNPLADISVLSISNPYFGLKVSTEMMRPKFIDGVYFAGNNYFPEKGSIRYYFMTPAVKAQATTLTTNLLFNFAEKTRTDGSVITEEKELNTVYTFGVLNFDQPILRFGPRDLIISRGDFDFEKLTSQPEKLLYVVLISGSFIVYKISSNFHLDISVPYLATTKLSLITQGPKALRSLEVKLESSIAGPLQLTVFVIQAGIVVGVSVVLLIVLGIWRRKSKDTDGTQGAAASIEGVSPVPRRTKGTSTVNKDGRPAAQTSSAAKPLRQTGLAEPLLAPAETTGDAQGAGERRETGTGKKTTLGAPGLQISIPGDGAEGATGGGGEGEKKPATPSSPEGRLASPSRVTGRGTNLAPGTPSGGVYRRTTNLKPVQPVKHKDESDSDSSKEEQEEEYGESNYMQGLDYIEERLLLGEGFGQEEYDNTAAPYVAPNPEDEAL